MIAVLRGDARNLPLPDGSVDLIVTSPPYFALRSYTDTRDCRKCRDLIADGRDPRQAWPDYQAHWDQDHKPLPYDGQIGSEATPAEWLAALLDCTREWVRVLKPSGSLFINLGDKFAGSGGNGNSGLLTPKYKANVEAAPPSKGKRWDYQPKSLLGLPWRYALAATDQLGLILRRDIIWAKPNGLPESVTDRCRSSHEYVFHLVKQPRYYAAVDEIREPHAGEFLSSGARNARYGRPGGLLPNEQGGNVSTSIPDRWSAPNAINPLGKLPGSVWDIPSQPLTVPAHLGVDHFAAFPMELPRRIIAGWSPPGICTACGEGRRPVSERASMRRHNNGRHGPAGLAPDNTHGLNHSTLDIVPDYRITGYACACPQPDSPTRPAVVLDPFGGTGTTALVAHMHGRTGISIDRSADYSRLAMWRTRDPAQRAAALQVPKPPPVPGGMEPLFEVTP